MQSFVVDRGLLTEGRVPPVRMHQPSPARGLPPRAHAAADRRSSTGRHARSPTAA